MVAAIIMLLVVLLFVPKSGNLAALFPIVLALYTPISYYTDKWLYDRRQAKKAKGGGKSRAK
jgi:hypothetical protein